MMEPFFVYNGQLPFVSLSIGCAYVVVGSSLPTAGRHIAAIKQLKAVVLGAT